MYGVTLVICCNRNYISSSAVKEEISKESSSNLNVESNKEGND